MTHNPHLLFTRHKNSFSVHIPNLEKLSVEQIKILQDFVAVRNGVFDFDSYSFSIQKKIEFNQFKTLIKHSGIDAKCDENILILKQVPRISFGQYKGMQYCELPDSYMLWLKTNYKGYQREEVEMELKKRNL
jgi:uncharacterized protein (DUF3820 family)